MGSNVAFDDYGHGDGESLGDEANEDGAVGAGYADAVLGHGDRGGGGHEYGGHEATDEDHDGGDPYDEISEQKYYDVDQSFSCYRFEFFLGEDLTCS